jgi:hypothetical protein
MIEQGSDVFDKKKQKEKVIQKKKKDREDELERNKKFYLF